MRVRTPLLWLSLAAALPLTSGAQVGVADYQRARSLQRRFDGLVADAVDSVVWVDSTHVWYRKSTPGGSAFVLVDATTGAKQTGADRPRAAQQGGFGRGVGADSTRTSPDGKQVALLRNYNVAVRTVSGGETRLLSTDGSEGNPYTLQSLVWSPDSKHLAAYRVRPGYRRMVTYVESSPADQVQPKTFQRFYAKPGDVVDWQQPSLFDVATGKEIAVDDALFPHPYNLSRIEWRRDGRAFTFEYNERGHQRYRVIEVNATTGAARALIDETSTTFIDYRRASVTLADGGHTFRADVADGKEIVWLSERDGWAHLYLYDGATGQVKNQITKGSWLVRGVQRVDEQARQIYFAAGGSVPGQDPYFAQYYRVNFDGTGLTRLTDADGNHTVAFSPDFTYYVDVWSRVDLPPVAQLRRTSDRQVVATLERGDATALGKAGWRAPEAFSAKGRDGTTDIYGVIVRPTSFDPKKKYPVIESIYAGPHGSFVPKSFAASSGMQALAELGFIVVQIDGMGTSNRSRAFHDVAWRNLADAGFPDRIRWHKAVAATYPWYDVSRVGIYGGSAGGQNALGALLFHPEFYKAAVSFAGCHDNRMDKIWWNEQWMGELGPHYAASSNVDNAYKLQGKLLLVVGELDTNVDPSSTMQVVNALIRANKTFDLLVMPGEDHPAGRRGPSAPYGDRKLYDFFVRNLLGTEPPNWNAVASAASAAGDDDALDGFAGLFGPSWDAVRAAWGMPDEE